MCVKVTEKSGMIFANVDSKTLIYLSLFAVARAFGACVMANSARTPQYKWFLSLKRNVIRVYLKKRDFGIYYSLGTVTPGLPSLKLKRTTIQLSTKEANINLHLILLCARCRCQS